MPVAAHLYPPPPPLITHLKLSQRTYSSGVIVLSCTERGRDWSHTNVQNRMYRVETVKESGERLQRWREGGAYIAIIIFPHLNRWHLEWVLWGRGGKEKRR